MFTGMKHELPGKVIICSILFLNNDFFKDIFKRMIFRKSIHKAILVVYKHKFLSFVIIFEIFQKIYFQLRILKAVFTLSIQRIADQEIWVTIFFQNKTLLFSIKSNISKNYMKIGN